MSRIEDPLRELLIRNPLTQQLSDKLLRQSGCTQPYAWLETGVLIGELGSQPRFSDRWLGMGHLRMTPRINSTDCLDRNPAWEL
jgi:hypothetical protein